MCTVPIIDDSVIEPAETLNLFLVILTGGLTQAEPSTAILTIDDYEPGEVRFTANAFVVDENQSFAVVTAERFGGSSAEAGARCLTTDGTALLGADYTASPDTMVWPVGDTDPKTCTVPILDDELIEGDETVLVSLGDFTGGVIAAAPSTATLTIRDYEPGFVRFNPATYTVQENGGSATAIVERYGAFSGEITVRCNSSNGTATTDDYTATSQLLTWAHNETGTQTCTVPILDDELVEGDETFNLNLVVVTDAKIGDPALATVTIIDHEPGRLQFTSATYSVNENQGTANISVERVNGTTGAVGVQCQTVSGGTATVSDDYTANNDQLSWADGEGGAKTCTVPILDDELVEGNETVNLSLNNISGDAQFGTPKDATLTIVDHEPGRLQFTANAYSYNENVGTANISVTRVSGTTGTVSVKCNTVSGGTATAGSDFTSNSDTLTWTDGQGGNQTCTIPILDDTVVEGNETVKIALADFTGGATAGNHANAIVTIVDHEPGQLRFTTSSYTKTESTGTKSINIERVNGTDGEVSVRCNTSSGTATDSVDYTTTTDRLTWADGVGGPKSCTVPVIDDEIYEGNETVNLSLGSLTGGAILGSRPTAVLTIVDDAQGRIEFTTGTYSRGENVGIANVAVERVGGSEGPLNVRCQTSNGTAAAPGDYTATNDLISWSHGQSGSKNCTIPIVDDVTVEGNETVNLTLNSISAGGTYGNPRNAVMTIVDHEPGQLRFSSSAYSVNENGGSVTITIRRVNGSDGSIGVSYATSNGTAVAGFDYTSRSGTLSWSNGNTANKTFTIPINNDTLVEANETVNLTLSNPTGGAILGSPKDAVLTINDHEPGQLRFSSSTYSVNENGGSVTITVRRVQGSDGSIGVSYATSNGTASSADYTSRSGNLSWSNGDTANKTFTIPINNDTLVEGNETVNLALSNPTGGAILGSPKNATLTINDHESGQIRFSSATYSVNENGGSVTITVRRVNGSDGSVGVSYATANGSATSADYTARSGNLSWSNGDTANKTFSIPITNDSIYEGNETVNLTLSNPTGGAILGSPKDAVLTIVDESPGRIEFVVTSLSVNEGVGTANIAVERVGGSEGPASIRCRTVGGTAVNPADYTYTNDPLQWAHGDSATKNCTVPIVDDSIYESNETIELTLTAISGGATYGDDFNATVTIVDQPRGQIRFTSSTYSVNENAGTASIAVERVGGSEGPASIRCRTVTGGTATQSSDYTYTNDLLTWNHGESGVKYCTVPIINDTSVESNETVQLTLTAISGATYGSPFNATLTIVDHEPGQLVFSSSTYSWDENNGAVTITVRRINGSDGSVGVTYGTSNGTAIAGSDYTARSGSFGWSDGATAARTFTIPIINDSIVEGDETVNIALSNPTGGATLGSPKNAVFTIKDHEHGQVVLSSSTYTVNENGGSVTITIKRINGSDGSLGVHYSTTNGTAVSGSDYNSRNGDKWWSDGDTSNKTFTIPIINDSIFEGNETVNIALSNLRGGGQLGSPKDATLTIVDQSPGQIRFTSSTYSVNENAGTASVAIERVGGTEGSVSVLCHNTTGGTATPSSDYSPPSVPLTWSHGQSGPKTCSVSIVNDRIVESNETVNLTLSNISGGATYGTPKDAVLTIINDDVVTPTPGTIQFVSSTYGVDENGGTAIISVTRTNGTSGRVSVKCTTSNGSASSPGDYGYTDDTLTWNDGQSGTRTCTVPIYDNEPGEGNETVNLSLNSIGGGATYGTPRNAVLTIIEIEECGEPGGTPCI